MNKLSDTLSDLQQTLDDEFKELSKRLGELNNVVGSNNSAQAEKLLNELFKLYIEKHRAINIQVSRLAADVKKMENQFNQIQTEKEQFKALYNSGMMFSTESELQGLIEFAMDQITYHLRAERGFLILINTDGEREYFVSKNFEGQNIDDPAQEVSTSVIKKTQELLQPVKVDDDQLTESLAEKGSFMRLGLRSVLSVPIIYRRLLLGVIYLDRKEDAKGFSENDLAFVMAFSKQIAYRVNELKEIIAKEAEMEKRDHNRMQELRDRYNFKEIIGKSEKLVKVLEVAAKVAPSEATVMILGESGVGKELIARAIHFNSDRFDKKFVAINCGAIPPDLLESELFGYEPGAFTGAVKSKPGKFELAHRGTLFLDEVAELPINLQAKILRVVQTKELERLGSTEIKKIDIRIISATNKNLQQSIKEGKFREDLYYRLKVVEIDIPPLRERKEDISLLVHYFISKHSSGQAMMITDEALDVLENYRWDGNIRELENVIQRAIVLANGTTIQINDLPLEIIAKVESGYRIQQDMTLDAAETDFRKWYVIRILRKVNNNKTKAAELLGINRTHFFRMLNQLGITE